MNFLEDLLDRGRGLAERRVRLGISGLSGSGKTVFVTALVHALLHPGRLSALDAVAENRYRVAVLRPQPSQELPRFPYEAAVARITGAEGPPAWPESTRRMAELRVSIRYRPGGLLGRFGDSLLHLDLFDYPGEWLLDLAMLAQDYASWSSEALAAARARRNHPATANFLDFIDHLEADESNPASEALAIEAASRFTAYLHACRAMEGPGSLLQPGRFLLPGELEGSPLLTFAPLPPPRSGRGGPGSLRQLMADRYDAYLEKVVRPFYTERFARLDRQVVLVDLSAHVAGGTAALAQLGHGLDSVLRALKIGSGWLPRWLSPRIDRVLFAAAKADHLPTDQHEPMARLLRHALADSLRRTAFHGAETEVIALAAVRATREVVAAQGGDERRYLAGWPMDGAAEIAHFPGRLPDPEGSGVAASSFRATAFRPPAGLTASGPWPHLRLDRAIQFLIGDRLA